MKISIKDRDKVTTLLNNIQKKCKSRLVSYEQIIEYTEVAERYLRIHEIPKKYWKGVGLDYAELIQCNSYYRKGSYTADSTHIRVTKGSKDWFIILCCRDSFSTAIGKDKDLNILLSNYGRDWLRNNCEEMFFKNF